VASPVEQLKRLAFFSGPPPQANELIHKVRQDVTAEHGRAVNYEVPLVGRTWEYIDRVVAPRLALYLRSKRYRVSSCAPVFLSVFLDDGLYFVRAPDFYRLVREMMGLSVEAFEAVARRWEETGQPAAQLGD